MSMQTYIKPDPGVEIKTPKTTSYDLAQPGPKMLNTL